MSQNIYYRAVEEPEVYVQHHGVSNMTWHNRRWQNKDGTWTAEGKERRRAEYARIKKASRTKWTYNGKKDSEKESGKESKKEENMEKASEMSERAFKAGKDGKPSPAEKIGKETVNIVDKTGNIIDIVADVNGRRRNAKIDLSSISDEELIKVVNRLGLEKRYIEAISKNDSNKMQNVQDFLSVVGGLAGIGLSIAGIITAIHKIKGNN